MTLTSAVTSLFKNNSAPFECIGLAAAFAATVIAAALKSSRGHAAARTAAPVLIFSTRAYHGFLHPEKQILCLASTVIGAIYPAKLSYDEFLMINHKKNTNPNFEDTTAKKQVICTFINKSAACSIFVMAFLEGSQHLYNCYSR